MFDTILKRFPSAYIKKADDGCWDVWVPDLYFSGTHDTIGIGSSEKEACENAAYYIAQRRARGRD